MKFGYTTVGTERFQTTLDFYQNLLGFSILKKYSPETDVEIAYLGKDGHKIEVIRNKMFPAVDNSRSAVSLSFTVDDINKSFEELKSAGVDIMMEPVTAAGGLRLFYARDPNGVRLGFIQE